MNTTSVQQHYDRHLGPVYTWMAGGAEAAVERGAAELDSLGLKPETGGLAVDLGAGFGMHAIPLARRGFRVLAVDACAQLLEELRGATGDLPIVPVLDDLRSFPGHVDGPADLVLCMGDTLTHLPDTASVERLIGAVSDGLKPGGRFVLTLRDYTRELAAQQRFIPVRSDENRILTCFLEYADAHVAVHDILHERDGGGWEMRVSSYRKLRISPDWLMDCMRGSGFRPVRELSPSGMIQILADRN